MSEDIFAFQPSFQLKVAAMLLGDRKFYRDYIDRIEVQFFEDHAVGAVVGVLKSYKAKYGDRPDAATLGEYYRTVERSTDKQEVFDERLGSVLEAEIGSGSEFTRERIKEFLVMSALKAALMDTIESVTDGNADPSIITKFRAALSAGDVEEGDGITWGDNARKILKDELDPSIKRYVSTGLPHFDQALGGGLRPGELGILLGPPKAFKSGCLLNFAWGANQRIVGKRCDYLTLELSEELQMLRYCFRVAGLGRNDLLTDPDKFMRVMDKRKNLLIHPNGEFRVKFMPPYACTPQTIRNYLDRQIDQGRELGMLAIDYLDLMGSDEKMEKNYLEAVRICTALRQIAIDYQIPVWTAARATREAVGKRKINMGHMAASFERVAIADTVWALCSSEEEKLANRMRLVPLASRNDSGSQIIECRWLPRIMSIRSVEARDMTDDDIDDGSGGSSYKGKNQEERKAKAKESINEMVKAGREKMKKEVGIEV